MEARLDDREEGRILFVTDSESGKRHEVDKDAVVGIVFIDADQKAYLSITGVPASPGNAICSSA